MKREAVNTFDEGMIGDLNPINMPPKALTDCLNGTLVTYDDNELSLQNDKGNYPLIHCRLKPGYVPVGTKEYNGIIYIVSHNPVTNKTEIGSYPSPGEIKVPDTEGNSDSVNVEVNWNASSYEDFCTKNSKLYNFIFDGGEDAWLINPGDQIYINYLNLPQISPLYYQYYLINKEHNSTDVTKEIVANLSNEDFWYVPWKGSGWLAVKPTLPNISDFRINIRKFKLVPYTNTLEYSFNVEMEFDNNNNLSNYLVIDIDFPNDAEQSTTNNFTVDPNGRTIKFWNYSGKINNVTEAKTFIFKPYIMANNTKYYYASYEKTIVADPNNTASIKDVEIASRVFRYRIDSRATSSNNGQITFEFSSGNIDEAALYEEDIELYYVISKFNYSNSSWSPVGGIKKYSNFNLYGTNLLAIETSPFTSINEALSTTLFAEDLYRIQFIVTPTLQSTSSISDANTAGGITSDNNSPYSVFTIYSVVTELMNGYSADRYDQVPVSTWINKYPDTISESLARLSFDSDTESPEITVMPDSVYTKWVTGSTLNGGAHTYDRVFTTEEYNAYFNEGFNINVSAEIDGNFSLENDLSILSGPFWKDIIQEITIKLGDTSTTFNEYTGKIEIPNFTSSSMIFESPIHCKLRPSISLLFANYSYEDLIPYSKNGAVFTVTMDEKKETRGQIIVSSENNNGLAYRISGVTSAGNSGGNRYSAERNFYGFETALDKLYTPDSNKELLFIKLIIKGPTFVDDSQDGTNLSFRHVLLFRKFLDIQTAINASRSTPPTCVDVLSDAGNYDIRYRYLLAKRSENNYIYFDLGDGEDSAWSSYIFFVDQVIKVIHVEDEDLLDCVFIESEVPELPNNLKVTESLDRSIIFNNITSLEELLPSSLDITYGILPDTFSDISLSTVSLASPISINIENNTDLATILQKILDTNTLMLQEYGNYKSDENYQSILRSGIKNIDGHLVFNPDESVDASIKNHPEFIDALNNINTSAQEQLCLGGYAWDENTKKWRLYAGPMGNKVVLNNG